MAKHLNVNLQFTADTGQAVAQVKNLQSLLTSLTNGTAIGKDLPLTKELMEAQKAAGQLKNVLNQSLNTKGTIDIGKFTQNFTKAGMQFKDLQTKMDALGPAGSKAFSQLAQSVATADAPLRKSNKLMTELSTTLKNTARWQLTSSMIHGFVGGIQEAYSYVQQLDKSLNNIRIVSGLSAEEMARFAEQANKSAQALSTTTTKYTDAALIYYQQGLGDKEVKERTDTTIKMANVTGEQVQEVSSYMTAIWNNFNKAGDESTEHYADIMTKLGATTAASTKEIAAGLSKFSAVADTIGLSFDMASSSVTAIVDQTRETPEIVGTALKTIFSRVEGLKQGETLEDGVDLNKYSSGLKKVGVDIMDASGQLKDMDTILHEIGDRWETLDKNSQVALAQTVAGIRQYNQFIALFDNWNKVEENLETAAGAGGTLQEQADIYAESWEAARNRVKSAAQDIYNDLLDDGFFKTLLNGFAGILRGIDGIIDSAGGLMGVLSALSAIFTKVFEKQMLAGIANVAYNFRQMTKAGKEQNEAMRKDAFVAWGKSGALSDTAEGKAQTEAVRNQAMLQEKLHSVAKGLDAETLKRLQTEIDINKTLNEQVVALAKQVDLKKEAQSKAGSDLFYAYGQNQAAKQNPAGFRTDYMNASAEAQATTQYAYNRLNYAANANTGVQPKLAFLSNLSQKMGGAQNSMVAAEIDNLVSKAKAAKMPIEVLNKEIEKLVQSERLAGAVRLDASKSFDTMNQKYGDQSKKVDEVVSSMVASERTIIQQGNAAKAAAQQNEQLKLAIAGAKAAVNEFGQGFVKGLQGVSSLTFGISSLVSAFKTLQNQDMSFGEKFLSVTMSLSMAIPMLVTGFQTLKAAVTAETIATLANAAADLVSASAANKAAAAKGKKAAATKVATDGSAGYGKALGALGKNLWQLAKLHPVVAGVVLATAAAVAVGIAIWTKDERAAKKAAKAAEGASKAYDAVKTAHDNMKASLDAYDSAAQKMSELKRGTYEWAEALNESNNAVLDLLDKYPELAKYVDNVNGKLVISQQGKDWLEETSLNQLEAATTSKQFANAHATEMQLESDKTDLKRKMNYSTEDGDTPRRGSSNPGVSDKVMNQAIEQINTGGSGFLMSPESIQETLGVSRAVADALYENKDELIKLSSEVAANTEAQKVYGEQMAHNILEDDETFKNASESDQEFMIEKGGEFLSDKADEIYEDKYSTSKMTDKEAQEAYAELIGAEASKNKAGNVGEYLIDGEWQTISDETARLALAQEEANGELAANTQALLLFRNEIMGDHDLTESQANELAGFKTGDETIDVSNMDEAERTDLQNRTDGKGDDDIQWSVDDLKTAGYEGVTKDNVQYYRDLYNEEIHAAVVAGIEAETEARNNAYIDWAANFDSTMGYENTAENKSDLTANQLKDWGVDPELLLNYGTVMTDAIAEGIENGFLRQHEGESDQDYNKRVVEYGVEKGEEAKAEDERMQYGASEGLSGEDLEYYSELTDQVKELNPELEENDDLVNEIAADMVKFNKASEKVAENGEEWANALNSDSLVEMSKVLPEIRESYGEMLDIDPSTLSDDFVENAENLELMREAAAGSEEALLELQKQANLDYVAQIDLDDEAYRAKLEDIIIAGAEELQGIEVGASIDDTAFFNSLVAMAEAGEISVDQMNEIFGRYGVTPEIDYVEMPFSQAQDYVGNGSTTVSVMNKDTGEFEEMTMNNAVKNNTAGETMVRVPYMKGKELPKSSKLGITATKTSSTAGNAGGGRGSGGGGRSSARRRERRRIGKKDKNEEIERYHVINNKLEDMEHQLSKIEKAKDRAFGKNKLKLMDDEIAALEKNLDLQKQYQKEVEDNLKKDKDKLKDTVKEELNIEVKFDKNGTITNYNEIMNEALADYEDGRKYYNGLSASNQESLDEKYKKMTNPETGENYSGYEDYLEAEYEKVKEAISQYEDTQDLAKEAAEQVQETIDAIFDKKLEKVEYTVELKVDVAEDSLKLIDFLMERVGESAYTAAERIDLLGQSLDENLDKVAAQRQGLIDLFNNHELDGAAIVGLMEEGKYDEAMSMTKGTTFTEAEVEAMRNFRDATLDALSEARDMQLEMIDLVGEVFDEHMEDFDKIIEKTEHLQDVTAAYGEIVSLVGREASGVTKETIKMLNATSAELAISNIGRTRAKYEEATREYQMALEQRDAMMANASQEEIEHWNEVCDEIEQGMNEAHMEFMDSWKAGLEAARQEFQSNMALIIEDFKKQMGGLAGSLDGLANQFDLQSQMTSNYLPDYERVYELNKLMRDINDSIDETDNVKAKRELLELEQEINKAREDGKPMSEYDLNYLRKRYELKVAELSLKEAQDAKSQVRMTKDSEGNFGYVYTADDAMVEEAEQSYEDKLFEMQEMNAEYINTLQQSMIDLNNEYASQFEQLGELYEIGSEEYVNALNQLNEWYANQQMFLQDQMVGVLDNNKILYEEEVTAYAEFTNNKAMLDLEYISEFNQLPLAILTGYTTIGDYQTAWKEQSDILYDEAGTNAELFKDRTEEAMNEAGDSMETLGETLREEVDLIKEQNEEITTELEETLTTVQENWDKVIEKVKLFEDQYTDTVNKLISLNEKLTKTMNDMMAAWSGVKEEEIKQNNPTTPSTGGGGGGGGGSGSGSGKPSLRAGEKIGYTGRYHANSYGTGSSGSWYSGQKNKVKISRYSLRPYGYQSRGGRYAIHIETLSGGPLGWIKPSQAFDTGGYTGKWGGKEGRMAMLHQKEIVLNETDTANFLKTVEIVRKISQTIDLNALSSAGGLSRGLHSTGITNNNRDTLKQDVHITAEFPNATDKNEILQAFDNVINLAAQYANRK